jgi:hypothetical protein
MDARTLARGLAANRLLFGVNYLVRPQAAGPSWIGRAARAPGTQVMTRAQGARDIALALGALRALASENTSEARVWMGGHALADGADLVATWLARDGIPRRSGTLALALAAGSTAVAVWSAMGLGE